MRRDVVPALRRRLPQRRAIVLGRIVGDGFRTDDDEDDDGDGTRRDVRDGVRTDDARVDVDAVVLMCGVNDFKRAPWGRTPEAFRRELDALVDEVRDVVGDECLVALPGVPMECATIFPPPLSYLAVAASDAWDDKKRRVAATERDARRGGGSDRTADRTEIAGARLATTVLLDTVSRARDVRGETDGGPDGSFRAGRDGEGWNTPERVGLRGVGAPHRGRGARGDAEADGAAETRGNGGRGARVRGNGDERCSPETPMGRRMGGRRSTRMGMWKAIDVGRSAAQSSRRHFRSTREEREGPFRVPRTSRVGKICHPRALLRRQCGVGCFFP